MNVVVIGVGSNSPDKHSRMASSMEWLREHFREVRMSEIYSTKALNGVDADYLNAVVGIETSLDIIRLNDMLKRYEASCGRTPESKSEGIVPMDLDIVVWNGEIVRPNDYHRPYFRIGYLQLYTDKTDPIKPPLKG